MSNEITGIRSVDIKIFASGYGVVNYNGNLEVKRSNGNGRTVSNHKIPKLRGYTNLSGDVSDNGYKFKKEAIEFDFNETPMYVSSNTIKYHLFQENEFDSQIINNSDSSKVVHDLLCSLTGLFRGYFFANKMLKRKTSLFMQDFIEITGNGNFETFTKSGEKTSTSIFSKITFGDTKYISFASINIEDLQFISLDKKYDREAANINNDKDGEILANNITNFIKSLDFEEKYKNIKAEFGIYNRKGTIFESEEIGILLNNDAISILVDVMIKNINNLSFNQADGYLSIDTLKIDYNDSFKTLRIKKSEMDELLDKDKNLVYAEYYKKKI